MTDNENAKPAKWPLAIIAIATFLSLVVFTLPLTTLDAMTAALALSPEEQAWIMSGMPLGAACGLLTAGALGDTHGRRRTFVGGLWLTALASIAAALSPSGVMLIAMRVMQGLGSAGIMACGLGLIGQIYTGPDRRHAAAIWASSIGAGVSAGPIIASLLLPVGGWPSAHWLIAMISALLGVMAMLRLPESPRTGRKVDLPGSVLLIVGLGALLSALTEARLGSVALVVALAVIGLFLILTFIWVERRVGNPILQLDLFRLPDFNSATIAAFASGAGVLALVSMVPTVLVRGLHVAPIAAVLILVTWSGMTMLSALGARFLPDRVSARQWVIVSLFGCGLGQFLLIGIGGDSSWMIVLPGLFIAGVSNGILNASLGHEAVQTVPADRSAMGSAANNTARYLGSALGIAMISIMIANMQGEAFFTGWHEAVIVTVGFSLLGAASMIFLSKRSVSEA